MNRRERVKRAFHFNKPDRVPFIGLTVDSDFYPIEFCAPISWQPTKYPPHVNGGAQNFAQNSYRRDVYDWDKEIREKLGYSETWWEYPHESVDEFGVIWRSSGTKSEDKTMGHPFLGPLQDNGTGEGWNNLSLLQIPDTSNPLRYKIIEAGRWKEIAEDRYLVGDLGSGGIFNRCSTIRGFNNLLIDLSRNKYPNELQSLIKKVTDYNLGLIENMKKYCPPLDSIMIADDLGAQKSCFLSPRIFKKSFKDYYKKLVDLTHKLGMDFLMHSCGDVLALLPEFVDIGMDLMQFDSPHMTGVENFKHFAQERKMAFGLSSNIQSTFVKGSAKDVEEEIKYYIKEVGNNEGGLAIWEYTNFDTINAPKKNVRAQRKAVQNWGKYDGNGLIEWLN